jgi:anti-anti-sigma factor
MPLPPGFHIPEREDNGDVTVVRFAASSIRDEQNILAVFEQLRRLVEAEGRRKLVLDFGPVRAVTSSAIANLIALNKELQPPRGRLALCNLTPLFSEILQAMELHSYLNLYPTEQEALRSF